MIGMTEVLHLQFLALLKTLLLVHPDKLGRMSVRDFVNKNPNANGIVWG